MTWMILLTTTLSAMASCFEQVVFVVYMHVFRFCWPEAIKKLVCHVIPFKTLEINISVKKNCSGSPLSCRQQEHVFLIRALHQSLPEIGMNKI